MTRGTNESRARRRKACQPTRRPRPLTSRMRRGLRGTSRTRSACKFAREEGAVYDKVYEICERREQVAIKFGLKAFTNQSWEARVSEGAYQPFLVYQGASGLIVFPLSEACDCNDFLKTSFTLFFTSVSISLNSTFFIFKLPFSDWIVGFVF